MIFFRNFIFTYFDKRLLTHRAVIPYIEAALIAVIIISAILVIIALTPRLAQGRYTLNIITGLLLALSLCWSLSNYCFIFLDLALCWPLLVILMTTGLTALYHHWPGITAFMLPLWVTALLAGIQLHYHTEIRFLILWAILPRFCCMADVFCSAGMTKPGIPTREYAAYSAAGKYRQPGMP